MVPSERLRVNRAVADHGIESAAVPRYTWGLMDEDRVAAYKEAYETWQEHLLALHEVLLEHKRLDPLRLKGVLNRESRSKHKYDAARLRLLGIESNDDTDGEDE